MRNFYYLGVPENILEFGDPAAKHFWEEIERFDEQLEDPGP